jgi:hypothetical protein
LAARFWPTSLSLMGRVETVYGVMREWGLRVVAGEGGETYVVEDQEERVHLSHYLSSQPQSVNTMSKTYVNRQKNNAPYKFLAEHP